MVVQKTLDNLKERPHDEKKAVAGGVAITVVVILLIGWGFLFLRKIQNNPAASLRGGAVPTDQFNLNLIRDTERQLSEMHNYSADDLRMIRDSAAQNQTSSSFNAQQNMQVSPQTSDQFGTPWGDF